MQIATISVALFSLSACVAQGSMSDDATTTLPEGSEVPGEDSTTETEGESQASIASEYQLRSKLALTTGSLAPPPAYELLQDLDSDPGSALVSIATLAGLPAADFLYDALPSSVAGKLEGWMSDAFGSSTELQTILAWSQVVLAEVELNSTLTMPSFDADDHADASHVLDSLVFAIDGKDFEQVIPTIAALPGAGHAQVDVWLEEDEEDRHLVFGEHRFGLLVGEAAYLAFEEAVVVRYGKDLRALLGTTLDCAAMADEVADKCVLGVCVGHATELEALCEGALDEAVAKIHSQFSAFDTELLRLRSGSALVVSEAAQAGTRLEDGEWAASADYGLGLRDVSGSFVGTSAR